jgi:hypothetical protein
MSARRDLIISKLKAFAIHLGGSATVIAAYLLLVFLVWYPYPYFMIEKVWDVIRIVVSVDVFIGPLLTLVVYRVGKASLKFDLSAIIVVQLIALLWGVSVTYSQRPVYTAIVNDTFTVVSASNIDIDSVTDPALKSSVWSGPKLVYVDLPYSNEEYSRRGKENLASGQQFAYYTQYYKPIAEFQNVLFERAVDIRQRMREFADLNRKVPELVHKHGGELDDYIFMSVEARVALGFLMIRRDNFQVVDALVD